MSSWLENQWLCVSRRHNGAVGRGSGISLGCVNLTAQVKEIKFPIKSDTPCVIKLSVHHPHVEYTSKLIPVQPEAFVNSPLIAIMIQYTTDAK